MAMKLNRPATPKAENIQLGEGILIFNFDPTFWSNPTSIPFGATRGGGSYNVEPTNQGIRFDGDKGEDTKDLKRRTEWKITITANALELDHAKLLNYMPGTTEVIESTGEEPGYTKYRPNVDFSDTDYFDNLAYVTETKSGVVVAYVIENVLADGGFAAAMNDKDEIVSEVTFTAHFDPTNMDLVPTYILQFDQPPLFV